MLVIIGYDRIQMGFSLVIALLGAPKSPWVEVMDWLNANSGAMTALSTAILVVVTIAYVYLTHRLVRETKAAREMAMLPSLTVTAEVHEVYPYVINFRVENIGGGTAHNIRLQSNRSFMVEDRDPLNTLGLFTHGIPMLGPSRKIESFLVYASSLNREHLNESLKVIAKYTDATGRHKFEETFEIDFGTFENLSQVRKTPLHAIADSIHRLPKEFEKNNRSLIKDLQKNFRQLTNELKKLSRR